MNDTADTPARLSETARMLFAHKGFDAATVREITRRAGANLGAVTYHFGSKEALYHAILDEVFEDAANRIEAAARGTGTPEERLDAVVGAFFAFFAQSPDAPLLVIREVAGGDTPPAPVIPRIRRILAAITRIVTDGQRTGRFRPVEPHLVAFSLISQCIWFAVVGRHLPAVLGIDVPTEALRDRMRAHIGEVIQRAACEGSSDA